jgi:hypothetical protein
MGGIPIWRSTRTVTSKDGQNKVLTIGEQSKRAGVSRRDFLKFWAELMVAAPVRFAFTQKSSAGEVVPEIAEMPRPAVVWLHITNFEAPRYSSKYNSRRVV